MRVTLAIAVVFMALVEAHAGTVMGTVTRANPPGPIPTAQLAFYRTTSLVPILLGEANVAADGSYSFTTDFVGDGSIRASATAFFAESRNVQFTSGSMTQNFVLSPAVEISGVVRDQVSAQPLVGKEVRLYGSWTAFAATDDAGAYRFSEVPPGTFGVCLTDSNDEYIDQCHDGVIPSPAQAPTNYTQIVLAAGQQISNIDLNLRKGAELSGLVLDRQSGQPVARTQVGIEFIEAARGFGSASPTTDASGRYKIAGIAPGSYQLRMWIFPPFYTKQAYPNLDCLAGTCPPGTSVVVASDLVGNSAIDFNLQPGGIVSGLVKDSSTLMPIGGVVVELWADTFAGFVSTADVQSTDSTGRFTLRHALPGTRYAVVLRPNNHVQQRWPGSNCFADCLTRPVSTLVVPEHGTFDAGEFRLDLGTVILGRARQPGYGTFQTVQLYDSNGQSVLTVPVNQQTGEYRFPAWLAGTYYMDSFYDNRCERFQNLSCFGSPVTSGTPITLGTPGQIIRADFSLPNDGIARGSFEF